MKTHLQTDLQVHLVSLHLIRTVVKVKSSLVRLVLTGHLELVAAQRSEDVLFGKLPVNICPRQTLNVSEDVGVDHGFKLLQSVQISQVMHL